MRKISFLTLLAAFSLSLATPVLAHDKNAKANEMGKGGAKGEGVDHHDMNTRGGEEKKNSGEPGKNAGGEQKK